MEEFSVEKAADELKKGNFVILLDDASRENEGDLLLPAEFATAEKLNYMITKGRGILCVPIEASRLDELGIPLMVDKSSDRYKTPFTVTVDAKEGIATGTSVFDRAKTIALLINPEAKPEDLARPGHIFPLRPHEKGVIGRTGHTEAAVDLMKIAGLYPAAVIVEIMDERGEMAKFRDLRGFAQREGWRMIRVMDVVRYLRGKLY